MTSVVTLVTLVSHLQLLWRCVTQSGAASVFPWGSLVVPGEVRRVDFDFGVEVVVVVVAELAEAIVVVLVEAVVLVVMPFVVVGPFGDFVDFGVSLQLPWRGFHDTRRGVPHHSVRGWTLLVSTRGPLYFSCKTAPQLAVFPKKQLVRGFDFGVFQVFI